VTQRVGGVRLVDGVGRALAVHLEPRNTVSIDAVEVVAGVPAGALGLDARVKRIDLALSDNSLDARRVVVGTARRVTNISTGLRRLR